MHNPLGAVQVRAVVDTLLEVLTTPSASVQRAVSDCLPPLMQARARARAGGGHARANARVEI